MASWRRWRRSSRRAKSARWPWGSPTAAPAGRDLAVDHAAPRRRGAYPEDHRGLRRDRPSLARGGGSAARPRRRQQGDSRRCEAVGQPGPVRPARRCCCSAAPRLLAGNVDGRRADASSRRRRSSRSNRRRSCNWRTWPNALAHFATARDALVRYTAVSGDGIPPPRARVAPRGPVDAAQRTGCGGRLVSQGGDRAPTATAAVFARLAEAQFRAGDPAGALASVDRGLQRDPGNAALIGNRAPDSRSGTGAAVARRYAIPSRAISFASPWRVSPRSLAACARRPPARASAARTNRASKVRRASSRFCAGLPRALSRDHGGQVPGSDAPPAARRAAASAAITFCSSLTLPGQSYRASAASGLRGEGAAALNARGGLPPEVGGEHGDVVRPRSQGRHDDANDLEAVEQVATKGACLHRRPERAIGGGDDADVHRAREVLTDAPHLSFLDGPQHLRLRPRRQLPDLVQHEHAPVGFLEQPLALGDGSGERAPARDRTARPR